MADRLALLPFGAFERNIRVAEDSLEIHAAKT
jgi:hypothetical protein